MSHVINGETVYTLEEVDAHKLQATRNEQGRIADLTLDVLRDRVSSDSVSEEQALDIYNAISAAVAGNWPTIDSIVLTWTVYVNYNGDEVLQVNDVRAGTEDEAIDEVRNNLSIENARLSFTVEYNGEESANEDNDVEFDGDDIFQNLDFSAEEQD